MGTKRNRLLWYWRRAGLIVAALLFVCAAPILARAEAARGWQPERTWVFVVGTLEWKHEEMWDSFPKENRRDRELVRFFRRQGVPFAQIVYLRDREATEQRIEDAFTRHLSRARPGDFLFLYYTGHGYQEEDSGDTYLASWDAGDDGVRGWAVHSIPAAIERHFKGARALIALDNCYSGALTRAVRRMESRVSYAVLTSSTSSQVSTANWTFTEILLAALEGKAYVDTNNDGEITLAELSAQAKEDMAFAEDQRATFITTGAFSPQTVLALAGKRADERIGARVLVRSEGDWYKGRIIDASRSKSRFLIHYYGYDDSYDEWVSLRQIRWPHVRSNRRAFARPLTQSNSVRLQDWPPTLRMARMGSGMSVVM
ncbi:MAG TPA: Tudor-knot domain-containing protein [Pyrinomonadaceae bacterium]|jgi:hypothetical protein